MSITRTSACPAIAALNGVNPTAAQIRAARTCKCDADHRCLLLRFGAALTNTTIIQAAARTGNRTRRFATNARPAGPRPGHLYLPSGMLQPLISLLAPPSVPDMLRKRRASPEQVAEAARYLGYNAPLDFLLADHSDDAIATGLSFSLFHSFMTHEHIPSDGYLSASTAVLDTVGPTRVMHYLLRHYSPEHLAMGWQQTTNPEVLSLLAGAAKDTEDAGSVVPWTKASRWLVDELEGRALLERAGCTPPPTGEVVRRAPVGPATQEEDDEETEDESDEDVARRFQRMEDLAHAAKGLKRPRGVTSSGRRVKPREFLKP